MCAQPEEQSETPVVTSWCPLFRVLAVYPDRVLVVFPNRAAVYISTRGASCETLSRVASLFALQASHFRVVHAPETSGAEFV